MNSTIHRGWVEHARLHPVVHRFRNRVTFFALDLDELSRLNQEASGFGHNRFARWSLRDRDYLGPEDRPLREKLAPWSRELELGEAVERITLVTSLRWMGRVFNPVSFYLLENGHGKLLGLIAEVNNTFGDRHIYPVRLEVAEGERVPEGHHGKEFHVSPFNNMEGRYRFTVRREGGELYIGVDLYREGEKVIETWIEGIGVELSGAELRRESLRHPLRPWLTMARIVWQAMFLKFRHRLPVFKRPEPRHTHTIRSRGAEAVSVK